MNFKVFAIAAASLSLASCGVIGAKGNDTGGIIPWSPENEKNAADIAQRNCAQFGKHAVASSLHRVYGDYIGYTCVWDPPVPTPSGMQRRPPA